MKQQLLKMTYDVEKSSLHRGGIGLGKIGFISNSDNIDDFIKKYYHEVLENFDCEEKCVTRPDVYEDISLKPLKEIISDLKDDKFCYPFNITTVVDNFPYDGYSEVEQDLQFVSLRIVDIEDIMDLY